jgi:hypothetical protein
MYCYVFTDFSLFNRFLRMRLRYLTSSRTLPFLAFLALLLAAAPAVHAQPSATQSDVNIRRAGDVPATATRLVKNPSDGQLYVLAVDGDVYRLDSDGEGKFSLPAEPLYDSADHGLCEDGSGGECAQGMAFGPEGALYIVANELSDGNSKDNAMRTVATVAKGTPTESGGRTWRALAQTEPYLLSHTAFDHRFNGIAVSPDGGHVFLNSGSRTDHGEAHEGARELPITSAILRVPTDADGLTLQNDSTTLAEGGYLFADGTRNEFDLAFSPEGRLFGVGNAGDRDDSGELNWLREGRHYGFPWYIGGHRTPQWYQSRSGDGYDDSEDLLLDDDLWSNDGFGIDYFYDDPSFPNPPDDFTFTAPIPNTGPHADHFIDEETGEVRDASEQDTSITTFTAHRSMLALLFDKEDALGDGYTGDAFAMAYQGVDDAPWFDLNDPGEDLVHMELTPAETETGYTTTVTRIAQGFNHPIDAVLKGNTIYVAGRGSQTLWAVELPENAGPPSVARTVFDSFESGDDPSFTEPDPGSSPVTVETVEPGGPNAGGSALRASVEEVSNQVFRKTLDAPLELGSNNQYFNFYLASQSSASTDLRVGLFEDADGNGATDGDDDNLSTIVTLPADSSGYELRKLALSDFTDDNPDTGDGQIDAVRRVSFQFVGTSAGDASTVYLDYLAFSEEALTQEQVPVEFAGAPTPTVEGRSVQLAWRTLTETGNAGFYVQHRREGQSDWTRASGLVSTKAEGGTASRKLTYEHHIDGLAPGRYRFRVQQKDLDGDVSAGPATAWVEVGASEGFALKPAYPNPLQAGETATLEARGVSGEEDVRATLYNSLGQNVRSLPVTGSRVEVRAEGLASGLYFVRLTAGERTASQPVMLVR